MAKKTTEADLDLIERLRGEGRTWAEIGKRLGRLGGSVRGSYVFARGQAPHAPPKHREWTKADMAAIDKMREQGRTWPQIGSHFGVKETTVKKAYHHYTGKKPEKYKLYPNRPKKQKRTCLKCDREFYSRADRTCPLCQEANSSYSPLISDYVRHDP